MNDVKFIRDTLYDFKKRHSAPIKIVEIVSQEQNNLTGIRVVNKKTLTIKKAIRLPNNLKRSFVQDIAYLAANKNFTYGALNDFKQEMFIVDGRDVPKTFVPNLSHYFLYKGRRFDIVDVVQGDEQVYLAYIVKEVMQDTNTPCVDLPTANALEEIKDFNFAYGDAHSIVYTFTQPGRIINTTVLYRTVFNSPTATVTVGYNNTNDALLKTTESDPTELYEYSVNNDLVVSIGDTVTITPTPNGASQGSGVVTITISYAD